VLRSRQDEFPQCSIPGPRQEYGAEGLPQHVCGHVRLSVGPSKLPEAAMNEDERQGERR